MLELQYFLVDGIVLGAIYALVALGYTMVYGILGMINFAHGEIFMIGSFHAILALGVLQGLAPGLPAWAAVGLAIAVAMAFSSGYGFSLERIAYRPLAGSPALSLLITAVGMSFVLQNAVMLSQGAGVVDFPRESSRPFSGAALSWGGERGDAVEIRWLEIAIVATTVALMALLHLFIQRTRMGMAMRAVSQDRRMASLLGIDAARVVSLTFVIGSALAAAGGVLVAMYVHAVKFNDGYIVGMKAFTAAVLGGIGNIPGAMVGGLLLGIVENLGVWRFGGDYKDAYSFLALMGVLVFRPHGLLGERVANKV